MQSRKHAVTLSATGRYPAAGGITMNDGERKLQDRLDTRERADAFHARQTLRHLNDAMRDFIGRQEMMFLATADAAGDCDSTFRAGPPGFVRVLDEQHLSWPEYRGNGVMASLGNITENAHVGLLFIDFREAIGLHVNGTAEIVEDPDEQADTRAASSSSARASGRRPRRASSSPRTVGTKCEPGSRSEAISSSTMARACAGPEAMATATARLSSTIGEGATRPSAS